KKSKNVKSISPLISSEGKCEGSSINFTSAPLLPRTRKLLLLCSPLFIEKRASHQVIPASEFISLLISIFSSRLIGMPDFLSFCCVRYLRCPPAPRSSNQSPPLRSLKDEFTSNSKSNTPFSSSQP